MRAFAFFAAVALAIGALACSVDSPADCRSEDKSVSSTCPTSSVDFPGTKKAGEACDTAQECAGVCCPCGTASAAECVCGVCADQATACKGVCN